MDILVTQLIEEALANVNVTVVIALMALGFIVKHVNFSDKVNTNIIPPLLLLCSIIAMIFMEGFSITSIITAIINAAIAIGLHQQGKNIFAITIVPSVSKLFSGLTTTTPDETVTEIEEDEDTVDEIIEEE